MQAQPKFRLSLTCIYTHTHMQAQSEFRLDYVFIHICIHTYMTYMHVFMYVEAQYSQYYASTLYTLKWLCM
jgi:hypothetical protein